MTTIISIHYSLRGGFGDPDAAASLTALLALADRRVAGQAR
jgi:hypothetical protein